MSEADDRLNQTYNDIREIIKDIPHDKKKATNGIVDILNMMATAAAGSISNSPDPVYSMESYFTGFSTIALMVAAIPDDADPAAQLAFVKVVVGIVTSVLVEAKNGTEEKEEA